MADLEVMITMGQYKLLKEFEAKFKKNEGKSKQLEEKLWNTEQQLKSKHQELTNSNVKVKELSLNAIKLAKKVMISEDLLGNQEERWLKREKDLLQKMIELTKSKEHLQTEIQMGKEILRIKDQRIKEAIFKQSKLQKTVNTCQKQKESINKMYQVALKQNKALSIKNEEIIREYDQRIASFQHQWAQKIKVSQIQVQKLTQKNNQAELTIEKVNFALEKSQEQKAKVLKTLNQKLIDDKLRYQILLKEKESELVQLENKFKSKQRNIWFNLQELSLGIIQISTKLKNTLQFIQQQKVQNKLFLQQYQIEIAGVIKRVISEKEGKIQQLQKRYESLNKSKADEIQFLQNSYQLQKKSLEIQKEQLLKKITNIQQMRDQNQKMTKINEKNKYMRDQLKKQLTQAQNKASQLENQLKKCSREKQTIQQINRGLSQKINELQFQSRATDCKGEQIVEMNTQTLQLVHDQIYGKKEAEDLQNYKQKIDDLWTPVNEYLKNMKSKILKDWALQNLHSQILAEQLKLIFKRFKYLFDRSYQRQLVHKS